MCHPDLPTFRQPAVGISVCWIGRRGVNLGSRRWTPGRCQGEVTWDAYKRLIPPHLPPHVECPGRLMEHSDRTSVKRLACTAAG